MRIWVDADACPKPIKAVLFRAAERRRIQLARYFDLRRPRSKRCNACDACTNAERWLSEHLPRRRKGRVGRHAAAGTDAPSGQFQRGDWVRVGRGYGQVVKVEGSGKALRLTIESTTDLKRRVVDPNRRRVEKVER